MGLVMLLQEDSWVLSLQARISMTAFWLDMLWLALVFSRYVLEWLFMPIKIIIMINDRLDRNTHSQRLRSYKNSNTFSTCYTRSNHKRPTVSFASRSQRQQPHRESRLFREALINKKMRLCREYEKT